MSDTKGGLCLVVDEVERFRADLKLLDIRGGENEFAHSKRLASLLIVPCESLFRRLAG